MFSRESVATKLSAWKGEQVVVEGTFPIPVGGGSVAYAPAKGKLGEVFAEGFELFEGADEFPTLYMFANIRSVGRFQERLVAAASNRIITPGH